VCVVVLPWTSRGHSPYLRPAFGVSSSLCLGVNAPHATLDSEDFSDSFDADAGDGGGKKRSLHAATHNDMDKQAKNVENAVGELVFGSLCSTQL